MKQSFNVVLNVINDEKENVLRHKRNQRAKTKKRNVDFSRLFQSKNITKTKPNNFN